MVDDPQSLLGLASAIVMASLDVLEEQFLEVYDHGVKQVQCHCAILPQGLSIIII